MRLLQRHLCMIAMSLAAISSAHAAPLVEPTLHIKPTANGAGRVALTLDACGGQDRHTHSLSAGGQQDPGHHFRHRHLAEAERRRGRDHAGAYPDLFELENHGGRHVRRSIRRRRFMASAAPAARRLCWPKSSRGQRRLPGPVSRRRNGSAAQPPNTAPRRSR